MKTLLFQGDSITDCGRTGLGDGNNMGLGYPAFIAAELLGDQPEKEWNIINRGISGHRVVDLYARWRIDTLNLNPDILSILIGVNDTWHEITKKNGVEVERFEQIYRMLLQWTKDELPHVKLVLCEPFCLESEIVNSRWFYEIAQRSEVVQKLAKEFDATFVPLQQALSDAARRAGDNLKILRDGVHPALAGAQIISDQWLKTVEL